MECRILKNRKCIITQKYKNNHLAIDVVGENYTLDDVIAHSEGIVDKVQDGYDNMKGSTGLLSYGNYIRIKTDDEITTFYAHNQFNFMNVGDRVLAGQIIGTVGRTGYATGPHLHFEFIYNGIRYNPIYILNI